MKISTHLTRFLLLILAFALVDKASSQSCPTGLVAYWKMDETSGTNLNETKAGYDGERNSAAGNVIGKIGNSQRFTYTVNAGNNAYTYMEYAVVPHNNALNFPANSSFTISYWCRYTDYGYGFQDHILISKGEWNGGGALADGMWASGVNGAGKINFLLRDNTGTGQDLEGPNSYGNGNWHHVACVRDESTNRNILYVDGVITDQAVINYTGNFSTSLDLQFANLVNGGTHQYIYKGDLDEVAIFNKALSASEIADIIASAGSGNGICSVSDASPVITSTAVTSATVGVAYAYDVQASGTPSSIVYSLTTAPAGMTINSSTGLISWTPASAGSVSVVVKADNGIDPDATQSFTIVVSESPAPGACPTGLVAYWKMDETNGTTLIDSKAGHNAERNSVTGTVGGKIGNSQRFTYTVNGNNDAYTYTEYATVPNNSAFNFPANSSFTISYWCRYTDYAYGFQDHILISKGEWNGGGNLADGMWASGVNGAGKINFLLRDNTGLGQDLEGPNSYGNGSWHHVACVRDEATNRNILYVDGAITDQAVINYTGNFNTSMDIQFANLVNSGVRRFFYKGDLDEVAIFNTALSAAEIAGIIASGNAGSGICSEEDVSPAITSSAVTSAIVGDVYTYDVQATGTPAAMVYSLTTAPSGMTINSSTGLISWTPASVGSFPIVVEADNGVNPAATQSYTLVVSGTNPTITSVPSTAVGLGELYNYTVHATGTQTGMTYSLVSNPSGMTINSTSGLIAWTPGTIGDFDVQIRANNGIAPADTQRYTITVSGTSPIITSFPVTDAFLTLTYSYSVQASGTAIGMTFSLPVKPTGMTIDASSGVISWTPTALGSFPVEVVADNGIAPADTQKYSISVIEPTNCPDGIISLHRLDESIGPDYADYYDEHNATASVSPTAIPGIIDGAQVFDATTKIDIPDNGSEYDWLSSRSFSFEGWIKTTTTGAMVMVGRNRTDYVAARWFVGTNTSGQATFELRDNGGPNRVISGTTVISDGSWHHIVAVRNGDAKLNQLYVDGVREANVSYSYSYSFKADNPLAVTIGYLKGAADEMHFIGTIDEVAIYNRALSETEIAEFYNGGSPSGHCRGTNNYPYFTTSPATSVNEDALYSYTASVNDLDAADVLTISVLLKPTWMNFSWTTGQKSCLLSGRPSNSNVGENDVVLRVSDGEMSRDQIFRVLVRNVNDIPVITSTPVTSVNEGTAYSYVLTVSDVDLEDVITMTKTTLPSWLTFAWTTGSKTATITGTPDDANVGANNIDISISDGTVTIHESYILTVNQVNEAPVITGQSTLSVNEDNALTLLKSNFTITDPDNSSADLGITVQAGNNYTFSGNTITPASNFNGFLTVNVIAHDLALNSLPYNASVLVVSINDAPSITGQTALSMSKGGSLTMQKSYLTISDVDNASSDISITVQAGSNYTFSGNTITPASNFIGQLSVNVIASDLSLNSDVYPVIVTVTATGNEPPVITGQNPLAVNEDEAITILKNDLTITDADNPATDITINVQNGTNYTHNGNIVTPAADFAGQLSVNVVASDLVNNSQVFPVIITVNPVNDEPVITSTPVLSISVGNLYTYIFSATDVDNESLTKSAIIIPDWLDFSAETGVLAGTPVAQNVGQHLITLRVSDGIDYVDLSYTLTVVPATVIDDISQDELIIYPSPATDELNIRFDNLTEETIVEIISLAGTVVESRVIPANADIVHINVQHINAGAYFCHVKNKSFNKIKRFVIAR